MRFLFVSYAFPGSLGAMASWLGSGDDRQVIFASSRSGREAPLPNVQRALLKKYPGKKQNDSPEYFEFWADAIRAGIAAGASFNAIKASGFAPDVIFCASSNGAALNIRDIFPRAFVINFVESENFIKPEREFFCRDIQALQILKANQSFAFSADAVKRAYPPLRDKLKIIPPIIDCSFYVPGQKDRDSILLICDANPDAFIRLALDILKARQSAIVTILCSNAYTLRFFREFNPPTQIAHRLRINAMNAAETTRDLFSSAICVVTRHAGVAFAEALACGCVTVILGNGETENEIVFPVSRDDSKQAAALVAELVEDGRKLKRYVKLAREYALKNFCAEKIMPQFFSEIMERREEWLTNLSFKRCIP